MAHANKCRILFFFIQTNATNLKTIKWLNSSFGDDFCLSFALYTIWFVFAFHFFFHCDSAKLFTKIIALFTSTRFSHSKRTETKRQVYEQCLFLFNWRTMHKTVYVNPLRILSYYFCAAATWQQPIIEKKRKTSWKNALVFKIIVFLDVIESHVHADTQETHIQVQERTLLISISIVYCI